MIARGWMLAAAGALMLAACGDPEPTGQVIARVNGTDITRRDLMVEAIANGLPADIDIATARGPLLHTIVTRQLAVEEALRLGLDKTPDYQAGLRRTRATLLMDALRRRLAEQMPAPTHAEVRAMIAANPQMFAERHRVLATIAILPADKGALVAGEWSLDNRARSAGAPILSYIFDTAMLSPAEAFALDHSTLAAPALLRREGEVWVAAKQAIMPLPPTTATEQDDLARRTLIADRGDGAMRTYLESLRRNADIRFQPTPKASEKVVK